MRKALLLATLAAALTADVARAAPSAPASPYGPAVAALFGVDWDGVGFSGRVEIPIVDKVIKPIKFANQIVIEGGLDYRHISYRYFGFSYAHNIIRPQGGAMWNFWFTPQFAAYGTLRTGYNIIASSTYRNTVNGLVIGDDPHGGSLYIDGGAGVIFKLSELFSLRGELTGWGLQGGFAFRF